MTKNLKRKERIEVGFLFLNPLPNDKILDLTELEGFADDKINVT